MKQQFVLGIVVLLVGTTIAGSGAFAQQSPGGAKAPGAGVAQAPEGAKPGEAKKPEGAKPDEEKAFEDVVKDMEVIPGLFTFYRKAEDNKVLLEIRPDQLEKTFLFAATVDQSVGEKGLYASQQAGDGPFQFHRVGKSVQLVLKNYQFTSAPGTPQASAIARSFPDAILGSAKILSKPQAERKSILVDAAEFFVSDLPGFAVALNQAYAPTNYHFDKGNSSLGTVKAFPHNALVEVTLHYATDNPRVFSVTLADQRSVPIVMKYDLLELQSTGYHPRKADDRVGHFATIYQDFSSDHPYEPYVRYITRWQLEKADPSAKLSPPKQPIVFWIENTVPLEYREAMKEGVLLWNKAFERIGYKDAVVVKQMPDNADWDPADTRYSTLRWFAGVDATFAIGPSNANPYTGQIYNADIGFSEGLLRYARRGGEEFVGPVSETAAPALLLPNPWFRNPRYQCEYAAELKQQVEMGLDLMEARGTLTPEVEVKLMHEVLVEVTAHEVGHTLGLRHNFHASTLLKASQLNDVKTTEEIGQTGSVMDYNPVVIAAKGEKQGHFLTTTLGPYDYWAIEYAYGDAGSDEAAGLAKIASRVASPELAYATDEDAIGTYSPLAIDPLVNQFDQASDPLEFFRGRADLVEELWHSLDTKLTRPGEGYQILRNALGRGLREYNRALLTSSKFIGGIYYSRDHAGDPGARPPYTVVPAAKQREALEFLRTRAFSEKAFELSPAVLNHLAIERQPTLDFEQYFGMQRLDYPWLEQVLALQRNVLSRLYHPVLLGRVADNELRFAAGEKPFTMADLFHGLDSAIWSELDGKAAHISPMRRNLQREQLRQLVEILLRPMPPQAPQPPAGIGLRTPPVPRPPEDATTLAYASLVSLRTRIKTALASPALTDPTTRAHLEETQARITTALDAHLQKPLE
jgi:hypothetical protein